MSCFVFFPVSALQKLLKSVKIRQSCSQMYTATLYESRQKCRFSFFQVRYSHKSCDVINFTAVARRISSRLKRCKNYKNWLRLAIVIVKNKMSRFLWFTVYIFLNLTNENIPFPHTLFWLLMMNKQAILSSTLLHDVLCMVGLYNAIHCRYLF